MRLDTFEKNSITMFLASSLGSFLNLAYQWLILRSVSPATFAALNSLLALLIILAFPINAFTTMVAKHISRDNARDDHASLRAVWQALARHVLLFSAAFFLFIIFFSAHIADFLHINSQASIIILGAIIFTTGVSSVFSGGLQGLEKFKLLAGIALIGGFIKLLSPFIFFRFFSQLESALLGYLVALVAGIILYFFPIWPLLKKESAPCLRLDKLYFYILPVLASTLLFLLLTNFDMILVKHFFLQGAQDYALAQMFGKIILFLPGVVYLVMFARSSSLHAQKKASSGILKRTLLFTLLLGFIAAGLYNLFPEAVFTILAHRHTPGIITLGRIFSLSMVVLALCNGLFFYQLSVERYRFLIPSAVVTAAVYLLLWFWHPSLVWVAGLICIAAVIILLVNLRSALEVRAA